MPTGLSLERTLPELHDVLKIVSLVSSINHLPIRVETLAEIQVKGQKLPLLAFEIGGSDPSVPLIIISGGVHGLERIGSRVVIAFLRTVTRLLQWDSVFNETLKRVRLLFIPIVNPGGMLLRTRANPNGVDLMRNAPVEREFAKGPPLVGGHRVGRWLPWYRGPMGAPMELESQAVSDYLLNRIQGLRFATILDVHSGFGILDRLWIPFAYTRKPFHFAAEAYALKRLIDETYPNHVYRIEPQSAQYTTHGDLWDYLFLEARRRSPETMLLPLALELGSWLWIKKNPRQLLTATGMFNPLKPHRHSRILRRHLVLFDFLVRATASVDSWAFPGADTRAELALAAGAEWYRNVDDEHEAGVKAVST